jgi:hypothetical protein
MEKVKSAVSRVYGSVAAKEDSGRGHQEGARRVAQAFGYTVRPAGTQSFVILFSSLIHQIRKKSCHPSRKRPTWACRVAIRSSTPTSRRYAPHWRPFSALNSLNAIDLLEPCRAKWWSTWAAAVVWTASSPRRKVRFDAVAQAKWTAAPPLLHSLLIDRRCGGVAHLQWARVAR